MTAFRIEWQALVDDELLAEIGAAAGLSTLSIDLRPVLGAILSSVGGVPVADEAWTDVAARAEVRRRLAEACRCVAIRMGARMPRSAYVTRDPGSLPFQFAVEASEPVNLNTADRQSVVDLPVLGAALADRLIEERRLHGPFRDMNQMASRVAGVGDDSVERLRGYACVQPTLSEHSPRVSGHDLSSAVRDLVAHVAGTSSQERLENALECVAVEVAGDPHPASRDGWVRPMTTTSSPAMHDAEWVGVLWSTEYWSQLAEMLGEATSSIDVAMFHAAFPDTSHPSRSLLDALIAANDRGIQVRVLLDADRPTDLYRSTVINEPAFAYLESAGVPVRFDDPDTLLHSKFIVVDQLTSIVGSHNWSAGSFFQFDDVSLVVRSGPLATELVSEFDQQWGL